MKALIAIAIFLGFIVSPMLMFAGDSEFSHNLRVSNNSRRMQKEPG